MGERGAFAADTVASGPEPDPKPGPGPKSESANAASDIEAAKLPRQPSLLADYAVARVSARVTRIAGLGTPTRLPILMATGGLLLLRKPGRAVFGLLLLSGAGALAWLGRERPPASQLKDG
jgi:membrane protein